jgi:nucleotide-binding universal stress UspA family protein
MSFTFAALMVHFDAGPNSHHRLRLAVDLAIRFEAALIGISGRSYLPAFLANGNTVGAERKNGEQLEMTRALVEIGEKFHAATKHVTRAEWRGIPDNATNLVVREARAADLVIIGRGQGPENRYYALDPGITIVRAGRPVLVVPEGIDSLKARRIVVAWKDTREARRAVCDAIPLLKGAEEVMIVEICEHGTEAQSQQHINDLKDYLLQHEVVVAEEAYLHTEQPVANELLRFAKDEKADLIVAGGYGHSRLGEWMFGGVTRGLLRNSPISSLFSH